MRKAVISNGKVINVVEVSTDTKWDPPSNTVAVSVAGDIGIGWTFDGQAFNAPVVAPIPTVEITTKKFNGIDWVAETVKFLQDEPIQLSASIMLGDKVLLSVNADFFVPLFAGTLNVDGTITPTSEQLAILYFHIVNGVADPVEFSVNKSTVVCAVPGRSSNWLRTLLSRVIISKPAGG